MATIKQTEANRRNAQKSTGPKTPAGKETVSKNAVQHGLSSANPAIYPEEQERYDLFAARLRYEYQAQTALEEFLVEQIIDYGWRLRRIPAIESSLLRGQISTESNAESQEVALGRAYQRNAGAISRLSRHERGTERALFRTLAELHRLQYARGMNCDPFYVANMGKFPAVDNVKRKEEGRFRATPELSTADAAALEEAANRRLARVRDREDPHGDILT